MRGFNFSPIPDGSVLGISYSGMHDSAISIVSPNGDIVSLVAEEMFSFWMLMNFY